MVSISPTFQALTISRRLSGESSVGVHLRDQFAEAFLTAGDHAVVGRLAGGSMGTRPPAQPERGRGLPRLAAVDLVIVARRGLSEGSAE